MIAAPEGFRYYRDELPLEAGRINGASGALRGHLQDAAEQGGHPARGPLPRLGLHRRQRREHRRPRLLHIRDDAFAQLGDTDLADLHADRGTSRSRSTRYDFAQCGGDCCQAGEDNRDRPPRPRHVHRALLPEPTAARRRHASSSTPNGNADPATAPDQANFDCIIPRVGDRTAPARGRRARRSTGTACFGTAGEVGSALAEDARQSRTASSSARPTRSACRNEDVPQHVGDPQRPLQVPRARRPAPAGPAQRALPGAADDPARRLRHQRGLPRRRDDVEQRLDDRHQRPLLQRQQPGRDHGRRADGGRAGLHPRFARACRR